MEMSLHRVIAEIKANEQKLQLIAQGSFVYTVPADSATDIAEGKKLSQSSFDKVTSQLSNLAKLKAARNKANATTVVTIAGVKMTIDEALAKKAANIYEATFLNVLRSQLTNGKATVERVQAQIEQKIAALVASATSGTKKASDDEISNFRSLSERNTKIEVVTFDGMKAKLDEMAAALEQFAIEVDYVLSEANATTKVNVDLT